METQIAFDDINVTSRALFRVLLNPVLSLLIFRISMLSKTVKLFTGEVLMPGSLMPITHFKVTLLTDDTSLVIIIDLIYLSHRTSFPETPSEVRICAQHVEGEIFVVSSSLVSQSRNLLDAVDIMI
jgi:hypothetical protein